jgi:glycosyltransferase involved in cell wall biosynthesis
MISERLDQSISVVIPLYNKEKTVSFCLKSVISQFVLPSEIIIVDDGSTDSSLQIAKTILKHFNHNYLIIEQENAGVSVARNVGLKASRSNFVAFLDADDEWNPYFIEKAQTLINDYPHGNLYCFAHQVKDTEVGIFQPNQGLPSDFRGIVPDFFESSLKGVVAKSSKVIVNKQAFLNIGGFPEEAKVCEDIFVWMMLALNGSVVFDSYVGTLVNQFPDYNRSARQIETPYPITFYTENYEQFKQLKPSTKKYLKKIYFLPIISSIINGNKKDTLNRINAGATLFPFLRILFLLMLLLPRQLFINIRTYRRRKSILS